MRKMVYTSWWFWCIERTYLIAERITYLYMSHHLIITAVPYAVFHWLLKIIVRCQDGQGTYLIEKVLSSSHLLHIVYMISPMFPTACRMYGPYTVA
jgi:hypothetical protein